MKVFLKKYLLVVTLTLCFVAGCSQPTTENAGSDDKEAQTQQVTTVANGTAPVAAGTQQPVQPMQHPQADITEQETASQAEPEKVEGGILSVNTELLDLGNLEPGIVTNGSFTLTNKGKGILVIDSVHAPCRCTVPDLPKKELAPGESVDLKFAFDVGITYGEVIKKINLTTASPSTPSAMVLSFKANIRKVLSVEPENITFGLNEGYKNQVEVTVSSTDDSEFSVTGFTSTGENGNAATVKYDPSVKSKSHNLIITGNPAVLRNVPVGNITINTDHPKIERLSIRYNTKMPFDVFPKTKRFTPETQEERLDRLAKNHEADQTDPGCLAKIKVISNFNENFQLGDITCEGGYLKVLDVKKSVDGYEVSIELDIVKVRDNEKQKKYISDYLLIPIVGHEQDTLKVQCYATLKQ